MQIEKLTKYSTSDDGYHWYDHPTKEDMVNKINEIIDYINAIENTCAKTLKSIDDQKAIPKEPIYDLTYKVYCCPCCDSPFTFYGASRTFENKTKFCPDCGQAIDWSN